MSRRVPVRLQSSLAECGAACLAMVLGFHGRHATVREVSDHAGVGRDGLSALAILQVAREHGLEARAFSTEPGRLGEIPLPAVVHWEFNHFLVVERWTSRRVDVVDPAQGRRRLTPEEFDEGFTGVVLAFSPGDGFAKAGSRRRPWLREFVRAMLLTRRGLLVQTLVVSLILQLAGLVVPAFSQILVDDVLRVHADRLLAVLGAGLGIVALAQLVLLYLRSITLVSLRTRVDAELNDRVVRHLFALPYRYFIHRGTGDLVQRAGSIGALRQMLTGQVTSALLDGPLALGYIVLVLVRDPIFGACLMGVAAAQVALLLAARRNISDLTQRGLSAQAATQGQLIEAISGIETLKASGSEKGAVDRWGKLFTAQLNADARTAVAFGTIEAVLACFRFLAPAGLLWVGAWRVLDGRLSLGAMLALGGVAIAALTPLGSLLTSLQVLQQAAAHVERLADIMESAPEPRGARVVTRLSGRIALRGVSFRYDPRAPWTLRDVSIGVAPGQKIALVGRSGSGKSTLARVMLGLLDPTEGSVSYDGLPFTELERGSLRRHFGVVTQDPSLFSGTIRENISLGNPGAPLDDVIEAARMACVHDDIERMPLNYETRLSEGSGLSGGQRQRIALARALLARPRILLLDEATSNLDTATEAGIEANLAGLSQTRVVIAHRLSTVRDADQIFVLDQGEVVERGTHEQLLALGGHYADLVAHQSSDYLSGAHQGL
ncbi:peptidase domain-containing ABC transporter [Planotetraspora sp. GP83]|uniref:peptidase domain-containing ABC transporter n=1 Tax=Planotetraspora sp. GP83 TaxID=3156264 RepID=UPI0035135AA1